MRSKKKTLLRKKSSAPSLLLRKRVARRTAIRRTAKREIATKKTVPRIGTVTATIKTAKDGDPVLRTAHDVVRGRKNVVGGQDLEIEKGVGAVKDPRNSHQAIERSRSRDRKRSRSRERSK